MPPANDELPESESVPSPAFTIETPVPERAPPKVAVICGATTSKVAVPGESRIEPLSVRLLVPPKMTPPAAATVLATV